jgi:hypothetical protein
MTGAIIDTNMLRRGLDALATVTLGDTDPLFVSQLDAVLNDLRQMLVAKNAAYGNSALDPVRVFSKADPAEQLRVRIDDKISRLLRGAAAGEDTVSDLLGYLILLRIAERQGGAA